MITGCSSGLGRSLVERALAAGDRVVATARSMESLQPLLRLSADSLVVTALDVTKPDQVRAAVAEAHAAWGRIDVVVNNAGYGLIGAVEECSDEQLARNLDTNLMGPIRVIRAVLPMLRRQGSGHLIQISAAAAISNYAGFGIYGASKCGLEGISEALRAELAPLGIRVTIVQPGPFRTDFISRSMERAATVIPEYASTSGRFAQFLERMSGRQPGDPDRAAAAIVDMVHQGKAPLRLALGRYAVEKIRKWVQTRDAEALEWSATAASADFPP
jgi:NAD(P)-dependent dehydrogenase (short-subunit alcohol dehydrogenase family)